MSTASPSKTLNLTESLLYFGVFLGLIGVLLFLLYRYDLYRKQQFMLSYGKEISTYVEAHRTGIEHIFATTFINPKCTDFPKTYPLPSDSPSPCNIAERRSTIAQDMPNDNTLKDFSSTVFIKKTSNEEALAMCLSAETQPVYNYTDDTKRQKITLDEVLDGKRDGMVWQNYFGCGLREQVVIIPIKNSSGEVIGAIGRGVIE